MSFSADFVVIGAGIAGTSVAGALQEAGVWRFADVWAFCEGPPFFFRVSEKGSLFLLR